MKRMIPLLLVLACILSRPVFAAETWTGYLVNSKCYSSEQSNLSIADGGINVNYDRGYQVRVCRPDAGTASFALIDNDGQRLNFDAPGDDMAACIVRQTGRKPYLLVMVTGEKIDRRTVRVDSIALIDTP